ncbi:DUF4340 domain-containing protein [Glaciecola sp. 1036]|uniref:DUF4340 domain-containing protein n=1 Tax=Alteromonadaceae TaxID=72275 RepID=UPI003D01F9EB
MQKQLFAVIAVLILLAGAAVYLLSNEQKESSAQTMEPLISVAGQVEIEQVVIENSDGILLSAINTPEGWMANQLSSFQTYPVDQLALSELVRGLVSAIKIEAKSGQAKNHARLGLLPISDSASTATQVSLSIGGKTQNILIGNTASSQQGHYVRAATEDQMWLVDKTFNLPEDESDWLAQGILDLSEQTVVEISNQDPKNGFSISKQQDQGDANWRLNDVDLDNQPLKYAQVVDDFVNTLLNLRFTEVNEFDPIQWAQYEPISEISITDASGLEHSITLVNADGRYLLHVSGQGEQAFYAYWVYQIEEYQGQELLAGKDDFLATASDEE